MYILFGVILSIATITEMNKDSRKNALVYKILFLIMTLMLCLRYGQGTDYNAYQIQYQSIDTSSSILVNSLYHGEIGWYILMMVFKRLGCSFFVFVAIISLAMMIGFYKATCRYIPMKSFSLLMLYPTYYLTYMYSAFRQGLVLSLFIWLGLEFLENKKYIWYYLLITLLITLHTSAILLYILPLIIHMKWKKPGTWVIFAFGAMIVLGYTGVLNGIAARFGVSSYFRVNISWPAIIVRLLLGYSIIIMHREIEKYAHDESEFFLYRIYISGLLIYLGLSFTGTMSQRITMPMKAVETLLIPLQTSILIRLDRSNKIALTRFRISKHAVFAIPVLVIFVLNFELVKNINSYIGQGNYYEWVNVINYPYVSIFNKERIFEYISHFKVMF